MNISIFNGGRGASTIIKELMKYKDIKISSIVNTLDDGKSTGQIRKIFNMFGPSDIRKVQSLYVTKSSDLKIFEYRFKEKKNYKILDEIEKYISDQNKTSIFNLKISNNKKSFFKDCLNIFINRFNEYKDIYSLYDWSLMNIIYAGCYIKSNRSTLDVIKQIKNLFELKNDVIAITNQNLFLSALRSNGDFLKDEASIVEMRSNEIIEDIYISRQIISEDLIKTFGKNKKKKLLADMSIQPSLSSEAKKNISNADIIIYAPGTPFSSLFPSYMTKNINKVILNNKNALKFFITNIGADYETPDFRASDYIKYTFKYLNKNSHFNYNNFFDYNLVNLSNLEKNHVVIDHANLKKLNVKTIIENFEICNKGIHDGSKVINKIISLYKNKSS